MVKNYTYLELFLDDLNRQATLSEFERYFKKPHQTIKSHLDDFIKEKIINSEKRGRFSFYSLNKTNPLLKDCLSICEKERFFNFINKNSLFKQLYKIINPEKVLLFGSSVTKRNYNDIDILMIGKKEKSLEDIKKFEKTYSVKIHLITTTEKHLTKTLIEEIKKKHIIFTNHDYFIRVLYKDELGMV